MYRADCYIRTIWNILAGLAPLFAIGLTFNEDVLPAVYVVAGIIVLALVIRLALLFKFGPKEKSIVCEYIDIVMAMGYPMVLAYLITDYWGLSSELFLWVGGIFCILSFLKDKYNF